MTDRFRRWIISKWQPRPPEELIAAHQRLFDSADGRVVLQHWLDKVYCTVYEGKDPVELGYHNGRRSVVQELLELIDQGAAPQKYALAPTQEDAWLRTQAGTMASQR